MAYEVLKYADKEEFMKKEQSKEKLQQLKSLINIFN